MMIIQLFQPKWSRLLCNLQRFAPFMVEKKLLKHLSSSSISIPSITSVPNPPYLISKNQFYEMQNSWNWSFIEKHPSLTFFIRRVCMILENWNWFSQSAKVGNTVKVALEGTLLGEIFMVLLMMMASWKASFISGALQRRFSTEK